MVSEDDRSLIHRSVESERMELDHFVRLFYAKFFKICPDVRAVFPDDMAGQHEKLLTSLTHIIEALDHPEKLSAILKHQGERHRAIQITDAHFDGFIHSFTSALADILGPEWSDDTHSAWRSFLTDIALNMNFLRTA
ncbi:globin domain-containing protein [Phaeobacter piscinae]|uniref:globin domain-containing protein n=1 Tax=Phaeobacter piscinae TaxID=1580596 RepID=UPI00058C6257|nr:globin domain-containing protein [Phaeobacter piscinae]ATG41448.1 Hemoglobin-like flavoprotein [Phaeobacter piscinae]UTS82456.1 Flavohemoprotein [Phaeobacter piscinae]